MFRPSFLLIIPVAVGVWYYNYWAVGCGRCSYSDFWRIGPHTMLWAGVIVSVFGIWLLLRRRTGRPGHCPGCQRDLDASWSFCPDCGKRGR